MLKEGESLVTVIKTKVYAGRVKNKDALMASSSGGAFTVLSDSFLEKGDAVAAAVYNYQTNEAEFRLIQNQEERHAARGSKYMQSKPREVYRTAETWLKENPKKNLFFVGMGCQADGFRKFVELRGLRGRVYIVNIICHGSPSPKLWREYAQSIECHKGKIDYLTFKDKRNGWKLPTAFVVVNGQEVSIKDYVKVFYNRCALRLSCHECTYTTTEPKNNLTIGDFWHIEETIPDFYDPSGNLLFLIHTDRGEELFESVKSELEYRASDTKQCWQKNQEVPTEKSEQRDEFWSEYQRRGVQFIMKKYGTTPLKKRIKNKTVKILIIGGDSGSTSNFLFQYYIDFSERRAA
ncbi:Coenzyme F420 hydrogenase/dehydrogenase, beta subunit C-terminal domain [Anaerostipes faecalis]|uniref:Coenzyme F420 hydrogenase/dehydrogenase, beta subunit C-terminal domain n=1 Tax=Anaerostipes faecalis TaxID=2738446 RepID=UPI003EFE1365